MPGVLIPGIEMTKQCDQGFHRRPRQIGVLSRIYDSLVCKLNTIYSNAIPLPFQGVFQGREERAARPEPLASWREFCAPSPPLPRAAARPVARGAGLPLKGGEPVPEFFRGLR